MATSRPPAPWHLSQEKVTSVPGRAVIGGILTMSDSDYGGGVLPHVLRAGTDPPHPNDRKPLPHPWQRYGATFRGGKST